MPIEIVDLPNLKMVIFHNYVNVYHRVNVPWLGDLFPITFKYLLEIALLYIPNRWVMFK